MIQKHKRTIILLITSALIASLAPSCGTVRGIGEDVSSLGRGMKKAAS